GVMIVLIFRDLGALLGLEPLYGYFLAYLALSVRFHCCPGKIGGSDVKMLWINGIDLVRHGNDLN
ncbi:MAG: hypothetical protein MUQ30_10310, partial [Anaerolineae bacterium]|nr:hypothetical protein [Anaerolineae bacterium]